MPSSPSSRGARELAAEVLRNVQGAELGAARGADRRRDALAVLEVSKEVAVMTVEPMHPECVACLAEAAPPSVAGHETMVVVATMHHAQATLSDVTRKLCFPHRRRLDETLRRMEEVLRGRTHEP